MAGRRADMAIKTYKKWSKKKKKHNAKFYHDNPNIRHSHGEDTHYNKKEAWERYYRKKKRRGY